MFKNILKAIGKEIISAPADLFCSVLDEMSNEAANCQLDDLSDGFGNVIVDGEVFNRQEAEAIQSRGELFNYNYR